MAGEASGASAASVLTPAELAPVLQAAIERIEAVCLPELAASLQQVTVEIVDLPGDWLGRASDGRRVQIDKDAAGYGWFVDATPRDDAEFAVRSAAGDRDARPGSAARERVDLLSVVMHELGHVLGRAHEDSGVMAATLPLATRRDWDDPLAWLADEVAADMPGQVEFADAVDAVFAAAGT